MRVEVPRGVLNSEALLEPETPYSYEYSCVNTPDLLILCYPYWHSIKAHVGQKCHLLLAYD